MPVEDHPIFRANSANLSGSDRFFLTTSDGTRAVLIQDSTVRWCNVCEPSYHSMPLERPFNDVKHVIMSKNGEFLCLYSGTELRIIEIPWAYVDVSTITSAFQDYCFTEEKSAIRQVLFHPLAYQQETIVILKDDDTISIMNWKDHEDSEPDVINLSNGTYSLDASITDIKAITFGQDGLTLYALSASEGADIYAFYPCLAPRLRFKKGNLDRLMYKSLIQYEGLNLDTEPEVKRNTIRQLKFVSELQKEEKVKQTLEIPLGRRQVRGQGPFTIAPFPEQIYSSTGTAILSLPIGEQNELLVVLFDDGNVAILLQDLEPTMNWHCDGYSHNASLALVELLNLKSNDILQVVLRNDKFGSFTVLTSEGVYSIDTSKWSSVMDSCLADSDLSRVAELEFRSEVSFTALSGKHKSAAFWGATTEQSFISVSNSEVKVENISTVTTVPHKSASPENESRCENNTYEPTYSQPASEIMHLNQKFQKELARPPSKLIPPRERQMPLKNPSNEVQLELLTELSKDLFSKIALGQTVGATLHNRIYEQELDLTRQLKASAELMEKQQDILVHFDSQSVRSQALRTRGSTLLSRFEKFRDHLTEIHSSQKFKDFNISKKESDWFKEIRNQVLAFNSYVHHQKRLQEQLLHLKQEMVRIAQATDNQESQARDEWLELRHMLEEDTRILQDCNSQLNTASRQVPVLPESARSAK